MDCFSIGGERTVTRITWTRHANRKIRFRSITANRPLETGDKNNHRRHRFSHRTEVRCRASSTTSTLRKWYRLVKLSEQYSIKSERTFTVIVAMRTHESGAQKTRRRNGGGDKKTTAAAYCRGENGRRGSEKSWNTFTSRFRTRNLPAKRQQKQGERRRKRLAILLSSLST